MQVFFYLHQRHDQVCIKIDNFQFVDQLRYTINCMSPGFPYMHINCRYKVVIKTKLYPNIIKSTLRFVMVDVRKRSSRNSTKMHSIELHSPGNNFVLSMGIISWHRPSFVGYISIIYYDNADSLAGKQFCESDLACVSVYLIRISILIVISGNSAL